MILRYYGLVVARKTFGIKNDCNHSSGRNGTGESDGCFVGQGEGEGGCEEEKASFQVCMLLKQIMILIIVP
jgi:hypothetical protein